MDESSPTDWGTCPETVPLPIEGGGYDLVLNCVLAEDHEGPHLDNGGHVQWRATSTGLRYREELEAMRVRRESPESREQLRRRNEEYRQRKAEEKAQAASKYSQGKDRIREWLAAGRGQLCWREEEELNSAQGGGVIIKGTTAHAWLGVETACGQDRPKSSLLYDHMPEDPVRICQTCASVARRRRLPAVALED